MDPDMRPEPRLALVASQQFRRVVDGRPLDKLAACLSIRSDSTSRRNSGSIWASSAARSLLALPRTEWPCDFTHNLPPHLPSFYLAQRKPILGVRWLVRTQFRKKTVMRLGGSDHAPPRITL